MKLENPDSNGFQLLMSLNNTTSEISILDVHGNIKTTKIVGYHTDEVKINLSSFSNGVYLVVIDNQYERYIEKIIISK